MTGALEAAAPATDPPQIVMVDLVDLVEDPKNQIRAKCDQPTVERYTSAMFAGAVFPPITVVVLNGAPVLVDGWHRAAAAKKAGRSSLPAVVISATPNEMRWLAAEANMRHGLPLKRAEAREVFRAYVRAKRCFDDDGTVKSSRTIAAELNNLRSHETILSYMKQDFRHIWARMVRDDEEPRTDGGEPEQMSPDEQMAALVQQRLEEARAAMRGIKDPELLAEAMAAAEAVLQDMRDRTPWTPSPQVLENDDF